MTCDNKYQDYLSGNAAWISLVFTNVHAQAVMRFPWTQHSAVSLYSITSTFPDHYLSETLYMSFVHQNGYLSISLRR